MILKIFLKKWMKYILRMINKCWIWLGLVFEKKLIFIIRVLFWY